MVSPALDREALTNIQRLFVADPPHSRIETPGGDLLEGRIAGCPAYSLVANSDGRGDLIELMTTRDGAFEAMVHAYLVWAEAGSIRAWICHSRQTDRLCFTAGSFRIVLCDLRPDSPTAGAIVSIVAGAGNPLRLTIEPLVAHGVQNLGAERAAFVNFPTRVYDHAEPDKTRLPYDSDAIPFRW